jgi:hypothetical protein
MFSAKLYAELGRPDKYMAILEHGPSRYSKTGVTDYIDDDVDVDEAGQMRNHRSN